MAKKFIMPRKRIMIAIAVTVFILVTAITGTVVYLNSRDTAEATDMQTENRQENAEQAQEANTENAENEQQTQDVPSNPESTPETDSLTTDTSSTTSDDTATTTTTGTTGTTTTQTDNIQETTITRIETIETTQTLREQNVWWTPTDINAIDASARINASESDISISKTVETSGENLVAPGEEITYYITVRNNGEDILNSIEVKDLIPEMTRYIEDSADNNGTTIIENDLVVGLKWTIDLDVEEERTVSFKVIVDEEAIGVISNIAIANGEESEEVKTSVILSEKTSVITRDGIEIEEPAKIGDEITYTIAIENTGDIEGTINIKDDGLAELVKNGIVEIVQESKEDADKLINGTEIEVLANGTTSISATVLIKKIDGQIKNIATVGNTEIEEEVDTVDITATKTNNTGDNKVKPGDTFEYKITLTNSGNVAGKTTIEDNIPEQLELVETPTGATVTGNKVVFENVEVTPSQSVELIIKVKVKPQATGTFKNVAIVGDKEVPDENIQIEDVVNITAIKTNNDEDKKVKPGDTFEYKITLTNSGNVAGTKTVTDNIPGQLELVETPTGATVTGNKVIFKDVEVKPLETVNLIIKVKVKENATGKIENTAEIETEKIKDKEGLDIVKITAVKTSNITTEYVKVGQEVIYTIRAVNNGTIAGDAVITDKLPEGLTYVNATGAENITYKNGTVTWDVKNLAIGEQNARTITIKATVNDFSKGLTKKIDNSVQVDGKTTSTITIEVGKAKIEANKTSKIVSCERNQLTGTTVHENDEIEYAVTVSNTGVVEKSITVTDAIPNGLTYMPNTLATKLAGNIITTSATVINNQVKLENYQLQPGKTLEITFKVKVNALTEGIEKKLAKNVAIVDGKETTDDKNYKVVSPMIKSTKQSKIIECSKDIKTGTIVHEGDKIKYTITIRNIGKASGKVTLSDELNTGLTLDATSIEAKIDNRLISNISVSGNKINLTDCTLEAGKTLTITFNATVNTLAEGIYTAQIAKNVAIVNGDNISDEKQYTVVKPNVTSTKQSQILECSDNITTGTTVHEGDKIGYTITVTNTGTDSDKITITDSIPSGLTYVQNSLVAKLNNNTNVSANVTNGQVSLVDYTLEAGKTLTITFTTTVNTLAEGIYTAQIAKNIAIVDGKETTDKEGYEVEKMQVTSTKTVDKETAENGEILTYTITAKNISTIPSKVSISDPIPEGTEYVANSITLNGKTVNNNVVSYADGKITYQGIINKQNEELTLQFKVKITDKTIGNTITNKATINNEEKIASTKIIKKATVSITSTKINPINLVLVLDISGSMANNNKLTDLKNSSEKLINTIFNEQTESTITLITYSSSAKNIGTYTYAKKQDLLNKIKELKADGGTNIYDALLKATNAASNLQKANVVFLTDGSPTIPSSEYIDNIYNDTNTGRGYDNNNKTKIVEQATTLKSKASKVYSIGLGVNNFSDEIISYAEICQTEDINITHTTQINTSNKQITLTFKNTSNKEVKLTDVTMGIRNVESASCTGAVWENSMMPFRGNLQWSQITLPANTDTSLTITYTQTYGYFDPEVGDIRYNYDRKICKSEHKETLDGNPLFSQVKEKNGNQYHCITQKDYAKYLLNKISSDGTSMNVDSIATAFEDIIKDISTTSKPYTTDTGTLTIPETRTITSKVKVTIGTAEPEEYTLEQLSTGVNGLTYKANVGFTWVLPNELADKVLKLEYHV